VTNGGQGARDVDEVHDRAAQDEAKRIGIIGQDGLHHLGIGLRRALGLHQGCS